MRISDWSSDVCSSDLEVGDLITPIDIVLEHVRRAHRLGVHRPQAMARGDQVVDRHPRRQRAAGQVSVFEHRTTLYHPMLACQMGSAACRERECLTVELSGVGVTLKKKNSLCENNKT